MRTTLLVCTLLVLAAPELRAQSASVQAEVLFRNGKRLLKQGKVAEACAAFDASQRLDPTTSTVLNQANCREKNSQFATAWGLFLDAERDTRSAADEAGKQLHQIAIDHAAKLESRLSTLKIVVATDIKIEGLEIRRDNQLLDPAVWNQALPIDGGTYTISAKGKRFAPWSAKVTINNENDAKTVDIPTGAPAVAAQTRPPPAPVKTAAAPPAPAAPRGPETWYCTSSRFARVGTCKPQLDACEAFRERMVDHVHDLTPCAAAQAAVCFQSGAEHCAPSEDMCSAMRDAAARSASVAVSACETKRATATVKVADAPVKEAARGKVEAVDFDEPPSRSRPGPAMPTPTPLPPEAPGWSCTDSRRAPSLGLCKINVAQCEAFRTSMLQRVPDLSTCHDVKVARCFDLGKDPHCAPDEDTCDALRDAAKQSGKQVGSACYAKSLPPPK